tara:strand:- start:265 stop:1257 length:993 start_codon:yes stop_codon:yes gene_type:complete
MEYQSVIPNGPKGSLIKNKSFITYLQKNIHYYYNSKPIVNRDVILPSPQPVSIEKKDFVKLINYNYNVTLKLDGTRFLLYFITDKHDKKMALLINRAFEFYSIYLDVEDVVYDGTLLDGELIFIDNKWKLFIHDGLILSGNKISNNKFLDRINDIKIFLSVNVRDCPHNTIELVTKNFYNFTNDFNTFIEKEYNNNVLNDGLIFMPNDLPVISGTQYSLLKWKPFERHTFDFYIEEDNDDLVSKVYHLGDLIQFAKIHFNTEMGNKFITKTKNLTGYKNECILECNFNNNNFEPILVRSDKNHANSLRTIERTLYNIQENITLEDFQNLI